MNAPRPARRVSSTIQLSMMLPALSALVLGACSGDEAPPPELIRPVRYVQVFATGGGRERSFSGAAQAGLESRLSFKVSGTVRRIAVKVGDEVGKGSVIAELDPTDYQLQLQDAEASLAQAESQARNARANYTRVQQLYENNNASRADLDAALAQKQSAEAQVESITQKAELARLQLRYCTLTAPVAGSIASVDVEVNENVSVGKPIVMLTGGDVPEVEVAIPEILITRVREGDDVRVSFDAIPDETFPATITEVAVAAVGFATTYPVTVRLSRPDERIRPGMAAEVTFQFENGGATERILVPPVAVSEDRRGRFVFTVEPREGDIGVARRRDVTVGELTSDGIEITDGLTDGDLVIVAGVSRIEDGLQVRLNAPGKSD